MPVRFDTIRWKDREWTKPVYFCRCGAFGHFSETIGKKREWYCGWDREAMKPVCKAIKQEGKAG